MIHTTFKSFLAVLMVIMLLFTQGCTSIMRGSPSWLSVETDPSHVVVKLVQTSTGEEQSLTTPFKVKLSKQSDYLVVIDTPNYRSDEVRISRQVSYWFWGNILLWYGGIVGAGVDIQTGNMWIHNPKILTMDLVELATAPDELTFNVPLTLYTESGKEKTKIVPITFRKKVAVKGT